MKEYDYSSIKPFSRGYEHDFIYPKDFTNLEQNSVEYCIACIKACAHSVALREADDPDDALLQVSCINDMIHRLELLLGE